VPAPRVSEREAEAMRRVVRAAEARGLPIVLVGAGARLIAVDWRFGLESPRTTADWDFAVAVPDLGAWEALRRELSDERPGRDNVRVVVQGTPVDLVPFGPVEAPDGVVRWGSMALDASGIADAQSHAEPVVLAEGLSLRVPHAANLAAMKLVAFDERGREDDKDLRDLCFLAAVYERCGNEERLFDELGERLAAGLPFELAGPTLLGRDLARRCTERTRERAVRVLARIIAEAPALAYRLHGPFVDDESESRRERELRDVMGAMREGIASVEADR